MSNATKLKSKPPMTTGILARFLEVNDRTARKIIDRGDIPSRRTEKGQRIVEHHHAAAYRRQRQRSA